MADNEEEVGAESESDDVSRFWNEAVDAKEGKAGPKEEVGKANAGGEKANAPEAGSPDHKADEEATKTDKDAAEDKDGGEEKEGDEAETGDGAEEGEEAPDPWGEVPAELRKEHEDLLEQKKKYEHEARSNRGRLAALEKKFRELSQKPQEEEAPAAKDKKKEPEADPLASIFEAPDWQQFEKDFGTDVAGPHEAAMRRLFDAMHSRVQEIESQAKSLQEFKKTQESSGEGHKLEQMFTGWNDYAPEIGEDNKEDAKLPHWFLYLRENFEELESFAESRSHTKKWWQNNYNELTNAEELNDLLMLFEASRTRDKPKSSPKPNGKGTEPKPEPRPMTPKRKAQLESAASPAPRSAPGPGSRSSDLPSPDEYTATFNYFASKATR